MSWSPDFERLLGRDRVAPLLLLESLRLGSILGSHGRDELRLSSFPLAGYRESIALDGCSISHGELQPVSWSRSTTALTIGLRADPRRHTWRGQVIQLRMGFAGWQESAFQPIFTGQVQQVTYRQGRWQIRAIDLVAGLTSRFDTPTLGGLFYDLDSTALTASLATGGGTATVTSTADGFDREGSGVYLALVEPVSGDDAFWVAGSAKTSTTLTVSVGNVLDTTRVTAGIGSVVRGAVYVEDHPIDVTRKILTSTGTTGGHGAWDTLPASWSYAIPPWLLDHEDMDRMVNRTTPSTGGTEWVLHEVEPQLNGLEYLSQWLAPGGFWLAMRQGRLTTRGIVDMERERVDATITDDDVVDVVYEAWDATLPIEYYEVWVRSADNSTTPRKKLSNHIETRPTVGVKELYLGSVHANHTGWGDQVAARVGRLLTAIPERLTVVLRGWRLAGLTPGDVVSIRTSVVSSIYAAAGYDFGDRRLLVVGGGPDWFAGTTTLRLLAPVPVDGPP